MDIKSLGHFDQVLVLGLGWVDNEDHVEEVLPHMSQHTREGRSQHLLHRAWPARILSVLFDVIYINDRWVAHIHCIISLGTTKVEGQELREGRTLKKEKIDNAKKNRNCNAIRIYRNSTGLSHSCWILHSTRTDRLQQMLYWDPDKYVTRICEPMR